MKIFTVVSVALVVISVASLYILFSGAGKFTRMTTIGGIYAVEKPGGKDVTCFVNKDSGSMSCLHNVGGQ